MLVMSACTKEELNVADVPIDVRDDSEEFQGYLKERVAYFLANFRFDKANEAIAMITDNNMREEMSLLFNEYRTRADKEALFIVPQTGDTLFFLAPSEEENSDHLTRSRLSIQMSDVTVPKSKGVLSGLKKFPRLTEFGVSYALVDEVEELAFLTDLESFSWSKDREYYMQQFPNDLVEPSRLVADLSENAKLKRVNLGYVNILNIRLPKHKLDQFVLSNGVFNANDKLNEIFASDVLLDGESARSVLKLENNSIDSLSITSYSGREDRLKNIDISQSKLLKFSYYGSYNSSVESIKLNEELKSLSINAEEFTEKPDLPTGLVSLSLANYVLDDRDFSHLNRLKKLNLVVNSLKKEKMIDNANLKFPASLEEFYHTSSVLTKNRLDLSYLTHLKKVDLSESYDIKLPTSLVEFKLRLTSGELTEGQSGVLDFSNNLDLKRIYISTEKENQIREIIFPPNLTEEELHDPSTNFYSGISVYRSTKLTNMPEWMANYIYYKD